MEHFLKKSRYKICFQTKSKVWIYKNSRLRNFYKFRSKITVKIGRFARPFLKAKNMKWTVARRQMVPYYRRRHKFAYNYKNMFFAKQRLKHFYGGLKEFQLRNIFKKTWNKEHSYRCNIFLGSLEQRLSMILFRVRLLPTIFTCTQLIKHQGIHVNNTLITLPHYRVSIGDIVSISKPQWFIFYKFLFERLQNRIFGQALLLWRKSFILKKIQFFRLRKKLGYIYNLKLAKKVSYQKKRYINFLKYLRKFLNDLKSKPQTAERDKRIRVITLLNALFPSIFYNRVKFLLKRIARKDIRNWSSDDYFKNVNTILYNIYQLKYLFKKFAINWLSILTTWAEIDFFSGIVTWPKPEDEKLKLTVTFEEDLTFVSGAKIYLLEQKLFRYERRIRKYFYRRFKKTSLFKSKLIRYKRYFKYLLRKLKYKKVKKNIFKNWCRKPHWYIPQYLEIDFNTLRISFVYYPEVHEVFYGFLCSFKKIISFYKQRAL